MRMSQAKEVSDREWRQMRRTMSKLEFEPVPETPPPQLRSLRAEDRDEQTREGGHRSWQPGRKVTFDRDDDSRGAFSDTDVSSRTRCNRIT